MDIPTELAHSLIALFDAGSIIGVVIGVSKLFEWSDGGQRHWQAGSQQSAKERAVR